METRGEGSRAVITGTFTSESNAEAQLMELLGGWAFAPWASIYRAERTREAFRVVADDGSEEEPEAFTFGDAESEGDDDEVVAGRQAVRFEFENIELSTAYLPRSRQPFETNSDAQVGGTIRWRPRGPREARLGARLDGHVQTARDADVDTAWGELDYTENWIRSRADGGRVTVGTQTLPWGTVDLFPPVDRLSTLDLTAGLIEAIDGSRRASPSIRLESYGGFDADLLLIPVFRPAERPRAGTLWHPVDQRRGRLLGVPDEPVVRELVGGRFDHDARGTDRDPVGGIRVTQARRSFDRGLRCSLSVAACRTTR